MSTHCDDGLPLEVWRRVAEYFSEHPPKWRRSRNPRAERLHRLLGLPEPQATCWAPDPDHPLEKVCSKCGAEKHLMEFYLERKRGRRRAQCRVCCRAAMRRYRGANAVQLRAANRRYRQANRETCRAASRRWRRANPERGREYKRRYRERHPQKVRVRQATKLLRKLGLIVLAEHCQDCGAKATEHHHLNYEDPYAVVSLCRSCHLARHDGSWRATGPAGGGKSMGVWECGSVGGEEREGRGAEVRPRV